MTDSVGERIKALRAEQGMTLAELSEKAGLSISYLSQIERDKTTPSLATLSGLAKVFDVELRFFFENDNETARLVRANQSRDELDQRIGLGRARLSLETANARIEVYRVTLPPHTPPEALVTHAGEEFGFVLVGELTLSLGDECFVLAAGDSIHYDGLQAHTWSNQTDEPCVVIWARSPSRIERQT